MMARADWSLLAHPPASRPRIQNSQPSALFVRITLDSDTLLY